MKRIPICLCLLLALLLLGAGETTPGQEATTDDVSNPFVGTWVRNLDKFSNPRSLKSDVIKIEAQDNGIKFTRDRVTAEGNSIYYEMSPRFDGKDYPIIGSRDEVTSLRRINANSFELLVKRYGEEVHSDVVAISKDGMTLTMRVKLKNTGEQKVSFTLLYDKQEG